MKAIVLAGGEGSRLRPLTENTPKPLLPIGGIPAIGRILRSLHRVGIREAGITTGYLADRIEETLGREYGGVFLRYFRESAPLGTAGSVRGAEGFLSEPFFVLSGDAVFDFDLAAAAEFHREKGALVTLLLTRRSSPSEFGTVLIGEDGRVTGFIEKPSRFQTFTDLVNTGIYLCSPALFSLLPTRTPLDFGKDVFPTLLARGEAVFGIEDAGYWCDIGTPEDYLRCCLRYSAREDGSFFGQRVTVGKDVSVCRSMLLDGTSVGSGCRIRDSIVGKDCRIGKDAVLAEGCVIGDGCLIGDGALLGRGTRLKGGTVVGAGEIFHETWQATDFEAVCGEGLLLSLSSLTPRFCRRIGEAFAQAIDGNGPVGVMASGEECDRETDALLTGVRCGGRDALPLGYGFPAALPPICERGDLSGVLFLAKGGEKCRILLFDRLGLYPVRRVERKFLSLVLRGGEIRVPGSTAAPENAIATRYIPRALPPFLRLDGVRITVEGLEDAPSCSAAEIAARLLTLSGAEVRGDCPLRLRIGEDGRSGVLRCGEDEADLFHADALLIRMRPEWFPDPLPLPASFPACFSSFLSTERYGACPSGEEKGMGRVRAVSASMLTDACRAFAYFLRLMKEEQLTLRGLLALLPPFVLTEETIVVDERDRLRILPALGLPENDCILRVSASGTARITPDEHGYRVLCEAESVEFADEILRELRGEIGRKCAEAEKKRADSHKRS